MENVLRALGVVVVPVPEITRAAYYFEDEQIALVRDDLLPDRRDRALEWLVHRALETSPGH